MDGRRTVTLRNGVKMPMEGFGVFQITDLNQCRQAVTDALDSGYRLIDLCNNVTILPMVNQLEIHPFYQRADELELLKEYQIQPEAWAPFAEGMNGMFSNESLVKIAENHHKTVAQVILRWNVQRGIIVIPKSVHKDRMAENADIWDFSLSEDEMKEIGKLDLGRPQTLDTRKPSEVRRCYGYLENPVLTSL